VEWETAGIGRFAAEEKAAGTVQQGLVCAASDKWGRKRPVPAAYGQKKVQEVLGAQRGKPLCHS